jgi:tungstate transport system permease protein
MENAFITAFDLIRSGDSALWEIVFLSLRVSLCAVALGLGIALPLAALLATTRFIGRGALIVFINAFMGLPPVVVGLALYLLFSASGPLGPLSLLYTPALMIIAQLILVLPIMTAIARETLDQHHKTLHDLLRSLGANRRALMATLLWEARAPLAVAALAGLGRALAEVGAVMIVGGNINHVTRVMTTAIALETSRGALDLALGLGMVLLSLTVLLNTALYATQRYMARHA